MSASASENSARRLAAGDHESYFADFAGSASELARTLADGWLYRGERSVHADGPRGTDPSGLPLPAFVICLQNHDQVGNRAMGERLHHSADAAVVRALTVLLLLAPETPLLFMGQEWAASSPFLYFTDHEGDLGRRVREGRRLEFGQFAAFADPAARDRIPDPQDAGTFERSHLAWHERDEPSHAGMVRLHCRALAVRKGLASAGLSGETASVDVAAAVGVLEGSGPTAWASPSRPAAHAADGTNTPSLDSTSAVVMRRDGKDGAPVVVVARLAGAGAVRVPRAAGWARLNPCVAGRGERPAAEAPLVDTEAADVVEDPRPATVAVVDDAWQVDFARPGALVFRVEAS
jgi:maltooligosyltrehalose trehalohydrolase